MLLLGVGGGGELGRAKRQRRERLVVGLVVDVDQRSLTPLESVKVA